MEECPHATFITREVLRSDRSAWLPKLGSVVSCQWHGQLLWL